MNVRAKFKCLSVKSNAWNSAAKEYEFGAEYDTSIEEDRRFSKATPSGSVKMLVDNPAVSFELGKAYYFDITPVEAE